MKTNYLSILKDALNITWKNHYLWWFGLLVSLSSAGSSIRFFPGNNFENEPYSIDEAKAEKIVAFIFQNYQWIILLSLAIFLLIIIFAILGIIGRGALIDSIGKILKNEPSNFSLGFKNGRGNFWKIFFISFFIGLFLTLIFVILIIPIFFLFMHEKYIIGALMAVLAGLIFIPLVVLSAYLKIYGQIYAILGNLSFRSAMENGYNLFLKNISASLIMGLVLFLVNLILMTLLFLVAIPFALVFLGIGFLSKFLIEKTIIIAITTLVAIILFLLLLFIRSVLGVFTESVWILFFREIALPKEKEFLVKPVIEIKPDVKPVPTINSERE